MIYSTFIAMSLDGYIADKNGQTDWLHTFKLTSDGGYAKYYQTIDLVIMGSKTLQAILDFKIPWPYIDKTTYVFSSKQWNDLPKNVKIFNGSVNDLDQIISAKYHHGWVVGGGNLIKQYMDAKLLKEGIITILPTLLGEGTLLFDHYKQNLYLEKVSQDGQSASLKVQFKY